MGDDSVAFFVEDVSFFDDLSNELAIAANAIFKGGVGLFFLLLFEGVEVVGDVLFLGADEDLDGKGEGV